MSLLDRITNLILGPTPTTPAPRDEYNQATTRWQARNQTARAAGCRCGQPATTVKHHHGVIGAVPAETWTCDEHAGAAMWRGSPQGWQPAWEYDHPLEGHICWATSGPDGGPPTRWFYPVKPGGRGGVRP